MGDFFLLQMDDFFTEGLCFDNRKEGEGGSALWRSPILRRSAQASLAAWEWGKAKGRSPLEGNCGRSDPIIEAGAPSTCRELNPCCPKRSARPPGVVMVAPPEVPRNASRTQS